MVCDPDPDRRNGNNLPMIVAMVIIYRFRFMPVAVSAFKVESGPVIAEVLGTGNLDARYQNTVSAKIQGRIVELTVDQNDPVKEGQLLVQLDDQELKKSAGIAQAGLDAARATVERVNAEQARAKAVYEQAQRDYNRYTALLESKSISVSDVDKSREKLATAEADLTRAAAAIIEAEKQVITAEQKVLFEQARLADTRILSPFNGLVVRRDRQVGDIVVPGSTIMQLISTSEIWISAWVDESAMAELKEGAPARIVFRSEPQKEYPGKIARLGRQVDRESREFLVDVLIKELPQNWAIGQRAEVYIETGRKDNVLSIPVSSVLHRNGKPHVYSIEGGKAILRTFQPGIRGMDKVEVQKGLTAGDLIIKNPEVPGLVNGKRVSVK